MHGTYEANMTMHNADVIFAVGVRFDDRTMNNLGNIVRTRRYYTSTLTRRVHIQNG